MGGGSMMRADQRGCDKLRKIAIKRNYNKYAEGSCLIELGNTRIICTASVDEKVPPFLKGTDSGWVTAEYGMLPRASQERSSRESTRGRIGGRTHEIQRLIGRSLRAVVDLEALGERTILIDCDVLQADGGTRCGSITGGFIALVDCMRSLMKSGFIAKIPIKDFVAATSVGVLKGQAVLDLTYDEDSKADVDMNVAMTGGGKFVEVQGTSEGEPFTKSQMDGLLSLAKRGIEELIKIQKDMLGGLTE